jgi:hypothetical protein
METLTRTMPRAISRVYRAYVAWFLSRKRACRVVDLTNGIM